MTPTPSRCARCHRPLRGATTAEPGSTPPTGRAVVAIKRWPEGPICSGCFAKACETYGRCSNCDVDRLLPGISASGQGLCTDCAGGLGDFTCTRCGQEGWLHYAGVCGRCVLTERLTTFLDDGTGTIRPELRPLFASICAMSRPRSGILWLSRPHVPPILQALAKDQVPLTHDGLSSLTPWRAVVHVRDLLISCGILPPIDRYLFLFEQWLPTWLDTITDPEHRKLLHRFSTWHILRRLRAAAQSGPIGHYRNQNARCQLRAAAAFLAHLSIRGHDAHQCTQTDLDSWFATANSTGRQDIRSFLRWAIDHHTMARLTVPASVTDNPAPISNQQRIDLIRRIHTDPAIAPIDRVIALLILLYAQPLPRIVQLTLADITHDGEQVLIRLGDPPVPVPKPFAEHITTYIASRPNLTTATNPDSQLLFPGRRAGQPIHPTSVRLRLHNLGIPNLNARTRTIRELLLQAPAPVVATMLNYTSQRAERIAAEAGNTWKTYAAGDHTRRPHPTPDRR